MNKFLSGWRYITTYEEAFDLPSESIAIEDDAWLWSKDHTLVGCSQRGTYGDDGDYYQQWVECDDLVGRPNPDLPFFAWHPSFCKE